MLLSLYKILLIISLVIIFPHLSLAQPTVVIGNNGPTVNVGLGASSAKYATLNAAVIDFGSTTATLLVNTSLSLSSNVTVPSTMTLDFQNAGSINCNGYTLSVASPIIAPSRKIFNNCSYTSIVFIKDNRTCALPEWWGENSTIYYSRSRGKIPTPEGFTGWSFPFTVVGSNCVNPSLHFDIGPEWSLGSLAPSLGSNVVYHVNGATGSDGNSGLTFAAPLKNIHTAVAKADVGKIIISEGTYVRTGMSGVGTNFQGNILTKNLSIIGIGKVIISTEEPNLSWTNNVSLCGGGASSCPHVWTTTRSSTVNVLDPRTVNAYGDYSRLTQVGSVQAVEDTAGSWYLNGSNLYVRLSDDTAPTSYPTSSTGLKVCVAGNNLNIQGAVSVYIENIQFECGTDSLLIEATAGPNVPTIAMKNVSMKYSSSNNCLTNKGAITYCENCIASVCYKDGYNYHEYNGAEAFFFELNSQARNNGLDGAGNNNCTTSHDGAIGVRINSLCTGSDGPGVIDVNDGTKTWNLGVVSYSQALANKGDFEIQNTSIMWLHGCSYGGSSSTYNLVTGSGSIMRLRDTRETGTLFNVGSITGY